MTAALFDVDGLRHPDTYPEPRTDDEKLLDNHRRICQSVHPGDLAPRFLGRLVWVRCWATLTGVTSQPNQYGDIRYTLHATDADGKYIRSSGWMPNNLIAVKRNEEK